MQAWCLCLRLNSAVCFCWNKLRWCPAVEGRLHIEPSESEMGRDNFLALYVPDIELKHIKLTSTNSNKFTLTLCKILR